VKKRTVVFVVSLAGAALIGGACARKEPPAAPAPVQASEEITAVQMMVGDKTPAYEVVAPNAFKLAAGVRAEVIDVGGGKQNGWVLRMPDGVTGGYISCGCASSATGSCKTENDNPEHYSCTGGCSNSEGNPVGCTPFNFPGPPKDPFVRIRFVTRPAGTPLPVSRTP
jgi:hypothetical protein